MNEIQKIVVRKLLSLAYENGFGSFYSLKPIAETLGIKVSDLYDEDTESGHLWEYGPYGNGFLDISVDGKSACPNINMRDLLSNWSGFRG